MMQLLICVIMRKASANCFYWAVSNHIIVCKAKIWTIRYMYYIYMLFHLSYCTSSPNCPSKIKIIIVKFTYNWSYNKKEWKNTDKWRSQIDFKYLQGNLKVKIIDEKIFLTYLLILLERKYLQQRMFYSYISCKNSFCFISTTKYTWRLGIVLLWLDCQNFVQWTQKWHQTLYTLIKINNWQRLKVSTSFGSSMAPFGAINWWKNINNLMNFNHIWCHNKL